MYNKGPETAASIADAIEAVKNEIPILASLSLGNLENLKGQAHDMISRIFRIRIYEFTNSRI